MRHRGDRAISLAIAPVVLLAGALIHPYLGNLPNTSDLIEAVTSQPVRWATGHLVLGLGIALMVLAFFIVRTHLHDRGEDRWSFWSVPLVTVGLGLSGFMVGAEGFGGRAAADSADVQAFFEALEAWGIATYLSANLLLTLGLIGFAVAVAKSQILGRAATWVVVGGAVIQAVGLFLPMGWAAHLVAGGALLFTWPIAYNLWSLPSRIGGDRSPTDTQVGADQSGQY